MNTAAVPHHGRPATVASGWRRRAASAALAALAVGCTTVATREPFQPAPLLPHAAPPGAAALAVAAEVGALRREGASFRARQLAQRFAVELGDAATWATGSDVDAVATAVALAHLGSAPVDAPGGLADLLRRRRSDPAALAAFDAARRTALTHLLAGEPGAVAATLPDGEVGVVAGVLGGLAGQAAEAADDPAGAQARYRAAAGSLEPHDPLAAARLTLLAAAVTRDPGAQAAAWQDAVRIGAAVLELHPAVADPAFWSRAAELRPAAAPWPAAARRAALASHRADRGTALDAAADDNFVLWYTIAAQFRARGELLAALTALGRAEIAATTPVAGALVRVGQAELLAGLGRAGDGRSVLLGDATGDDPLARAMALATLAALALGDGDALDARDLLDRALAIEAQADWPGRVDAVANRGLALALLGETDAGLAALAAAAAGYAALADADGLEQCLANRLACLGGTDEDGAITTALQELRARGLPSR